MRFTSTQLTTMIVAVMLSSIPGTLLAVDAFTNVAIEDPVSGRKVGVDTSKRLRVSEVTSTELVTIRSDQFATSPCLNVYTVPSNRTLLLEAAVVVQDNARADWSATLYSSAGCGGGAAFAAVSSANFDDTVNLSFGSGVVVRAGQQVALFVRTGSLNGTSSIFLYGKLVPVGS